MLYTSAQLSEQQAAHAQRLKAIAVLLLAQHSLTVASSALVIVKRRRNKWARRVCSKWGGKTGPKGKTRTPLDWDEYMQRPHMNAKRFSRLFRMPKPDFDALVVRLEEHWAHKGAGRRQKLSASLHLAMTLRYLAGGQELDISEMYNVWDSSFYRAVHRTITALYEVLPDWPLVRALDSDTEAPLRALSEGFRARSHANMNGAIGAIDGLLIPIRTPRGEENAKGYVCRKGFASINVQGICDASYRITYASIARAPGAVHDSFAWSLDPMHKRLHGDSTTAAMLKRRGFYLIGDDAYPASHTLAVPWPGKHGAHTPQCAYNYHHSSARIAIEQTFGMLSRKWLLLKRPFEGSLRRTPHSAGICLTVHVCCKLVRAAVCPRARAARHRTDCPRTSVVAAQLRHRLQARRGSGRPARGSHWGT